jgi:uncharacterized protein (UPF0297 family)
MLRKTMLFNLAAAVRVAEVLQEVINIVYGSIQNKVYNYS